MATDTTAQADELLRYFEGGRFGVQKRFGEAIRRGFKKYYAYNAFLTLVEQGIDTNVVGRIINQDYKEVRKPIVELYIGSLGLDISELFGKPVLSKEDRRRVARRTLEDTIPKTASISDEDIDNVSDQQLKLFLILNAFDEL